MRTPENLDTAKLLDRLQALIAEGANPKIIWRALRRIRLENTEQTCRLGGSP